MARPALVALTLVAREAQNGDLVGAVLVERAVLDRHQLPVNLVPRANDPAVAVGARAEQHAVWLEA